VEANFEIKWIKSTMFRRMIEGGTIPDVTKWLENYLQRMKEVCEHVCLVLALTCICVCVSGVCF
jgi:hypothetical protein